jgi:hypothetical protein
MNEEAILELVFTARNMAEGAAADLAGDLDKVASKGAEVAGKVSGAFGKMSGALANAIGNSVENLTQGGDLGPTLLTAGAYMAGQLAEEFGGQLIERLAGSAIVSSIAGVLGTLGSTMGSIIAAAIPVGMALMPAILIGALVAAVTVLIVNEDIRNKAIAFVGGLVGTIVGALSKLLGNLPTIIGNLFGAAWSFIVDSVVPFIVELAKIWFTLPLRLAGLGLDILRTIIDGLAGFPAAVADIILRAFRDLKIDIGPFHIRSTGVTIDLPNIDVPHFAGGVTNFGGGLAMVGERGPEVVHLPAGSDVYPSGTGPQAGGVTIVGITQRDIEDMIDRGLYFRLARAAPAPAR